MTGGLIQLVATGVENMYLTEDPHITFFKIVYRRHTNFSIESIPQYFNITADFSNRVSCTIARNGDLINRIYLVLTLPNIPDLPSGAVMRWVDHVGYAILNVVELEIGGRIIDRTYGDWMYIWAELNKTNNQRGVDIMTGHVEDLTKYTKMKDSYKLYIPLEFWFCRNVSLSLPIIALTHSEVKINIEFANLSDCIIAGPSHYIYLSDAICLFKPYEFVQVGNTDTYIQFISFDESTMKMGYILADPNAIIDLGVVLTGTESNYKTTIYNPSTNVFSSIQKNNPILNLTQSNPIFRDIFNLTISDAFLYVDYVYLDNIERLKFAKSNHEYLIDVCQFDNDKMIYNINNKIKIGYSQPTKELMIRAQFNFMKNKFYNDPFNYTTSLNKKTARSLIKTIQLKLNGFNKESSYDKNFYTYVQSLQHHKSIAPLGLFLYSFALFPCNNQPSGSCNFSKIDDISICVSVEPITYAKNASVKSYAISYNIFRIMDGVGGLVFEN